jgi:hypothetical protein
MSTPARHWIGLGALLAMSDAERAALPPNVAIDINDLSGYTSAVFLRDLERDDEDAKRDGDWGEQEYIERSKV